MTPCQETGTVEALLDEDGVLAADELGIAFVPFAKPPSG